MHRRLFSMLCLALALQACGPSQGEILDMRKRARDLAIEDAQADLSGRNYQDVFGAAGNCGRDCDALNAGFKWAATRSISDPHDCSGPTLTFAAGCRAFAEEVQRRADAAAKAVGNASPDAS